MPQLSRSAEDNLIRVAKAHAGSGCRQNAEARAGCAGPDVTCFDDDDFPARPREFDRRRNTGDAGTYDDGVCGVGKRPGDRVVEVLPPAGEGVRQGRSLGVYCSASSRVSCSILTVQRASVELMRNWYRPP